MNYLLILLNKYRHCFAFSLPELGHSSVCEMKIDLHNSEPVVYRPYRLAMKEKEVVRKMVNELLENNIIRSSVSPFASLIVLVRKKSGECRLCIDYRALREGKWDDHLPDIQWGLNNTFNKGINKTPAEALFGIRPQGPSDSKVTSIIDSDIGQLDKSLEEIRSEVSSHIETTQKAQKANYDKSQYEPIKYSVGDLVRVERHIPATGNSKKLIPKYQGP
ncbi:unnamed protein product [Euphydryas editha]|uniref:Polyprotein n=1 Tax=Euphydryas editha TaxID=104508 RepID=A0AAU9TL41_EUPED|nr:unnamed protein product [Euphydryas editha]